MIRDLASQGIELGLGADDQLIIRAPEGAMDPETLEQIRHEKRRVMAVLYQTQPLDAAREKRQQKVLDMMGDDDMRRKYHFYADTDSEVDFVVVFSLLCFWNIVVLLEPSYLIDHYLCLSIIFKCSDINNGVYIKNFHIANQSRNNVVTQITNAL